MSEHLSAEQISRWMIGGHDAAKEAHVRECAKCRTTLASLESRLTHFRDSVWQLSDRQSPAFEPSRHRSHTRPLRWALAAAAALIVVTVPLFKNARDRQQEASDELLLNQVNAAVSRGVPQPMEPLIQLVQWGGPTEGKENKR